LPEYQPLQTLAFSWTSPAGRGRFRIHKMLEICSDVVVVWARTGEVVAFHFNESMQAIPLARYPDHDNNNENNNNDNDQEQELWSVFEAIPKFCWVVLPLHDGPGGGINIVDAKTGDTVYMLVFGPQVTSRVAVSGVNLLFVEPGAGLALRWHLPHFQQEDVSEIFFETLYRTKFIQKRKGPERVDETELCDYDWQLFGVDPDPDTQKKLSTFIVESEFNVVPVKLAY
jgi:hypothetical protein